MIDTRDHDVLARERDDRAGRPDEIAAGITAAARADSTAKAAHHPMPVAVSTPIRTAPVAVPASKAPFHTALATGRCPGVVRAKEYTRVRH